MKHAEELLTR